MRKYDLDMDAVLEDRHRGMSYNALARRYGCSPQVITRRIREAEPEPLAVTGPALASHNADDLGPWQNRGRCNDFESEAWFDKAGEWDAKLICHTCVVRTECLQDALDTRERFGVRGGLNPIERAGLLGIHRWQNDREMA